MTRRGSAGDAKPDQAPAPAARRSSGAQLRPRHWMEGEVRAERVAGWLAESSQERRGNGRESPRASSSSRLQPAPPALTVTVPWEPDTMMTDDAMDVDEAPPVFERQRLVSEPLRISMPRPGSRASSSRAPSPSPTLARLGVPFPSVSVPPTPGKQPSTPSPFKRPPTPTRPRISTTSRSSRGRSRSPTRSSASGSWGSWESSSRPSSPTKRSRSAIARPPSPTSLPWDEGKVAMVNSEPPVGTKRKRPASLRLHDNPAGIDPQQIVGKTLRRIQRGSSHPNLTLHFDDDSSYQVKIEGYRPGSGGLSKELEVDASLDSVLDPSGTTQLNNVVLDCAFIRLRDKAFERHDSDASRDSQWDQSHLGLAFKLEGMPNRWYTVWATMVDRDEDGECKLLSYDDVFLSESAPRRFIRHGRKKSVQKG